jgi:NAD(P)-dependent dehydrogenase (short-subunit alcohol dehydrogenase family)
MTIDTWLDVIQLESTRTDGHIGPTPAPNLPRPDGKCTCAVCTAKQLNCIRTEPRTLSKRFCMPKNSLVGQSVLITGGSSGIGKAVATHCVRAGASVAICARSRTSVQEAQAELERIASPEQRILARSVDVSQAADVKEFFDSIENDLPAVTALVNAAGVLGPKGMLDHIDTAEWVSTIHVNLIGTMLMCRAVLPGFRARSYGKIINFSGGGATSPRPRFSAYAASKAAIVRFTENLAHELNGTGIFVNAIAPGAVNTRMLDEVLAAGPEKVGSSIFNEAQNQQRQGGTSPDRAAELCCMLLSHEGEGITGRLISAVWDNWESLPGHKHELNGTDIYTLRRIVPRDRGLDW